MLSYATLTLLYMNLTKTGVFSSTSSESSSGSSLVTADGSLSPYFAQKVLVHFQCFFLKLQFGAGESLIVGILIGVDHLKKGFLERFSYRGVVCLNLGTTSGSELWVLSCSHSSWGLSLAYSGPSCATLSTTELHESC